MSKDSDNLKIIPTEDYADVFVAAEKWEAIIEILAQIRPSAEKLAIIKASDNIPTDITGGRD
jgi:hypothetical protein